MAPHPVNFKDFKDVVDFMVAFLHLTYSNIKTQIKSDYMPKIKDKLIWKKKPILRASRIFSRLSYRMQHMH